MSAPRIAVIGTGRMGTAIATAIARHAEPVLWASREPERAAGAIRRLGIDARAAHEDEAIDAAEIVIPTLWFRDLLPWIARAGARLDGRILVDVTNPFTDDFDDFTTAWGDSSAEQVQRAAPGARVVTAFKNQFWTVFDAPDREPAPSDVLVAGDDETARRTLIDVLAPLPFRFLDAGRLANSRTIERMTLLEREIALRYGHHPHVAWRIWGQG